MTVGGDSTLVNYGDVSETPWYPDRDSVRSIVVLTGANRVGYNSFKGFDKAVSITLPDSVRKIASSAFEGTGYYTDSANWIDGALYISKHLIKVDSETVAEQFIIRDFTISVAEDAFLGCTSIRRLVFSKDLRGIYKSALAPLTLDGIFFTGTDRKTWDGIWSSGNDLESQEISDVTLYLLSPYAPSGDSTELYWKKQVNSDGSITLKVWE